MRQFAFSDNRTAAGRQVNRRVEIRILPANVAQRFRKTSVLTGK